MLNKDDRDKSYEDHDESEYQFSEDEVNYELDSESKVETPVTPSSGNIFTRMSRSKRMLISAIVFLGLVFVVYKMVSPTTPPVAPTEIASTATPAKAVAPAVPQQVAPPEPVVAVTPPPPVPQAVTPETLSANMNVPAAPTAPAANLPPPGTMAQTGAQPVMQAPMTAPAQVVNQPMMQPAQSPSMSQPAMAPSVSLPTTQQMPPGSMPQAMQPSVPAMQVPAVQPQMVQQQIQQPTYPVVQTVAPSVGVMPEMPLTSTPNTMIQTPTIPVAGTQYAETQAAATMQSEYSQRMNEYVNANRDLQNQMQALNERVITMENQFNQLIRTLTRQVNEDRVQSAPPPAPAVQRIPYSVQAIIPGRAWLRSDNGETVTVAEGDIIKDLGRIVKIDPYDGIVEINTGSKIITLTYGTSN